MATPRPTRRHRSIGISPKRHPAPHHSHDREGEGHGGAWRRQRHHRQPLGAAVAPAAPQRQPSWPSAPPPQRATSAPRRREHPEAL